MKRNANIELYRCLCMLGVVCIHVFSAAKPVSHGLWSFSCPSLIGFIMISGWFGIHFKFNKLFRLFGVVFICSTMGMFIGGEVSWGGGGVYGKGYWYIWAYVFTMMLSPIIDGFVELCDKRAELVKAFVLVAILLWGWSFFAQQIPEYVPTVKGFGDTSGVILLCIYILMRLIRKLGITEWLKNRAWIVLPVFVFSGIMVFIGFRHNNSIFAFAFAYAFFILIDKIKINMTVGRIFLFLSPSMFSVYLLHMPMMKYMTGWCNYIESVIHLPHSTCQFVLALAIFFCCVAIDMPRRLLAYLLLKKVRCV